MPATRRFAAFVVCLCLAAAEPPTEWWAALDHISAASLRGHLSFIASDALEGRDTPSRGLDVAAEYIAAQFRRAGLDPVGDDGYFQNGTMFEIEAESAGFQMRFTDGEQTMNVGRDSDVARVPHAVDLQDAPVYRVRGSDAGVLPAGEMNGAAVVIDGGNRTHGLVAAVSKRKPAVIIRLMLGNDGTPPRFVSDPNRPDSTPVIHVSDAEAVKMLRALKAGLASWKLSLHVAADRAKTLKARNVAGLLRGSDPTLNDTCVLLTAHYDHLGLATSGDDRVFNGANDNGSGTVSVIEIAAALATLPHHPRRSILFIAFFGEEKGLRGSRYYAAHPAFPLAKTVANVNLEQVGRTDATEGPQIANATFTGFEYSDVPAIFQKAGRMTGIKVYEARDGDNEYFERSDNLSFAERGIPAHTVVVAAEFPDYHAVGDKWRKIDYDNMAKVDRMLALGTLMLADNPQPPKWDAEKAGRYASKK